MNRRTEKVSFMPLAQRMRELHQRFFHTPPTVRELFTDPEPDDVAAGFLASLSHLAGLAGTSRQRMVVVCFLLLYAYLRALEDVADGRIAVTVQKEE